MKPIFNTLEFDGINSLEQGVFITGESVYNAPERDVESVEIAGRSGDYLLDKGRWKNIDVTYTCGCFGEDQDEFAKKIRNFRNLLASRYGYHRLVDSYNPEEYRLGVFKNPVEVDSQSMKRAGEFDVTFNCKPQRYLMSGETEQVVTSGEKLYNPTPFDSNPLLAVKGYGTIEFNGYSIEIENAVMGTIIAYAGMNDHQVTTATQTITITDLLNAGDSIYFRGAIWTLRCSRKTSITDYSCTLESSTNATAQFSENGAERSLYLADYTFSYGTAGSYTGEVTFRHNFTQNGTAQTETCTFVMEASYDGARNISITLTVPTMVAYSVASRRVAIPLITADSTISILGTPTYIDCDLGDAYMIKDGAYVGLNRYIDLGSDLPTLASGSNEITFDNTVTELKIVPRWWIL